MLKKLEYPFDTDFIKYRRKLGMSDEIMKLKRCMFESQRFAILQAKINPITAKYIPDDYAYAWNVGMYPLSNSGDLADSYNDCFDIKEDDILTIASYIDDEWIKKQYYTFYELEDFFKKNEPEIENSDRIDLRTALIFVLRYYFLRQGFDQHLWDKLLERGEYPIEAEIITSPFDVSELRLC